MVRIGHDVKIQRRTVKRDRVSEALCDRIVGFQATHNTPIRQQVYLTAGHRPHRPIFHVLHAKSASPCRCEPRTYG